MHQNKTDLFIQNKIKDAQQRLKLVHPNFVPIRGGATLWPGWSQDHRPGKKNYT